MSKKRTKKKTKQERAEQQAEEQEVKERAQAVEIADDILGYHNEVPTGDPDDPKVIAARVQL